MGATPLSMPTTIRGKSVDGNTATEIVNARYPPIAINVMMTKITGREKRAVQCSAGGLPAGETVDGSIIVALWSLFASLVGLTCPCRPWHYLRRHRPRS